ncbi:MAG: MFS transporter [Candidatus Hodarchaeota archaeon]
MIDFKENRTYRYSLYASIYLTEGMAALVILVILPIYLKNYKGLSDLAIAILAGLSLLPIVLKPIMAIFSDNYSIKVLGGRRKPYILLGFILNGISLPLIGIVDPVSFLYMFGIIWVLQTSGIALMDVAIDALVTESFSQTSEKVNANIVFYIANTCSVLIIIPIAYVSETNVLHFGLHLTPQLQFDFFWGGNFELGFLLTGIICIALIIFTLFLRENNDYQGRVRFSKDKLVKYLRSKYVPTLLLMFFLVQIDSGLMEFTLDPFFRVAGLTASAQLLFFLPAVVFSILGSVAAKWFVKKGIIKSLIYCISSFAGYYLILCLLIFLSPEIIPVFYYFAAIPIGLLSQAAHILLITIAMNSADKDLTATTLTLLITMINLGRLFGILLAGVIPFTGDLKMGIIFLVSAIVMVIRVPIFLKLRDLEE